MTVKLNTNQSTILTDCADWGKMIKPFITPNTKKATEQLLNTFIPFNLIWVFLVININWLPWYEVLILESLCGFLMVRIFIIQHDCGHVSFLKSRKWMKRIGFICSLYTGIPFEYWARTHEIHHNNTGVLELRDYGDIDFYTVVEFLALSKTKQIVYKYLRAPSVILFIYPLVYAFYLLRLPVVKLEGWKMDYTKQLINNIWILITHLIIIYIFGWKAYVFVHVPIMYIFMVIAFWFFYVQHQHEHSYKVPKKEYNRVLAAIKGSTYYVIPLWLQWLVGNINLHHLHHLSTRIPNYNLQACADANPILQKHVTKLSIRESWKCFSNKLWDSASQRMITFPEFKKTYNK